MGPYFLLTYETFMDYEIHLMCAHHFIRIKDKNCPHMNNMTFIYSYIFHGFAMVLCSVLRRQGLQQIIPTVTWILVPKILRS